MRNRHHYEGLAATWRKALRDEALQKKREADPNAVLTLEDEQAIDKDLTTRMQMDLAAERPVIDPAILKDAIKTRFPEIDLEIGDPNVEGSRKKEIAKRREKQMLAAISYATGYARYVRHIPGYGDFSRDRAEQWACRIFTPQELENYTNLHQRLSESYYQNKGLSAEEVQQTIRDSQKEITHLMLRVTKRIVDEFEAQGISSEMSDEDLIQKYPDLVEKLNFINEAHSLINPVRSNNYKFADFPQDMYDQYYQKISKYMDVESNLNTRMMMLADPNYPELRLEELWKQDPNKLYDADIKGILGEDEKDEEEKTLNYNIYLMPSKPLPTLEELAAPSQTTGPGQYKKELDAGENIFKMIEDIGFAKNLILERKIASRLGMTVEEFRANTIICDKDGVEDHDVLTSISAKLTQKSPLYIINRFGDGEPLPLMLDKANKDFFNVLVGQEEIAAARSFNAQEPPKPGRMARMGNWLSKKIYNGQRSEKLTAYHKAKDRYDEMAEHDKAKEALSQGNYHAAVNAKVYALKERRQELETQKAEHRKNLENTSFLMRSVDPNDLSTYENALAQMLIDRAFTEPNNSPLRRIIFDILKIYEPDVNRKDMINKFKASDNYREFVWKQRKDITKVYQLLSHDEQISGNAFDDVCHEFVKAFNSKKFWEILPSKDYNQAKEQRLQNRDYMNTLEPGKIVRPSTRERLDRLYDNKSSWQTVLDVYGPVRNLRVDWTEFSNKRVYNVETWRNLQNVNLQELKPEGKAMDERTFAALAMMLSIREPEFFTNNRLLTEDLPDTLPFEDVLQKGDSPRDGLFDLSNALMEPTRDKMLTYLKHMNETLAVEGNDNRALSGKDMLAKDLAYSLKNFASRSDTYAWDSRQHAVLAEVCGKVMDFAQEHGMIDLIKANGLTDDEIEKLNVIRKYGEIVKNALDAQFDLIRDQEGSKPLSFEERLDRLDKIVLLKAVQVDIKGSKKSAVLPPGPIQQPGEPTAEYAKRANDWTEECKRIQAAGSRFVLSANAKNLLEDGSFMRDLADRMLPQERRERLAKASAHAVYSEVDLGPNSDMDKIWPDYLQNNEAAENRRHMQMKFDKEQVEAFNQRLGELRADPEFKDLAPVAEQIMRSGSRESQIVLAGLSEEALKKCNEALMEDPDMDFDKALQEQFKKKTAPMAERQPAAAVKAAGKAPGINK